MTRFLQTNDPNYDPRQELIPRAPEIDGSIPRADVSTPAPGSILSDWWAQLFGGDWWVWLLGSLGGIIALLWSVYTFLAYVLCLLLLVLYIYATIKREYYTNLIMQGVADAETAWNQTYRRQDRPSRLDDVRTHSSTENPNDWKLAIIEADVILDQVLKERGYYGDTLGERLRHITPSQLASIDEAWDAHRVRNKIAHEGADFVLTRRITDDTIARYLRVFAELGVE